MYVRFRVSDSMVMVWVKNVEKCESGMHNVEKGRGCIVLWCGAGEGHKSACWRGSHVEEAAPELSAYTGDRECMPERGLHRRSCF